MVRIIETKRPDLIPEIQAGTLSVAAAYRQVVPPRFVPLNERILKVVTKYFAECPDATFVDVQNALKDALHTITVAAELKAKDES